MKTIFTAIVLLLSCCASIASARCESESMDLIQVYGHPYSQHVISGSVVYTDTRDPFVITIRAYIDPNPDVQTITIRKEYVLQFYNDHDVQCYLLVRYLAEGIMADGFESKDDE